MRYIDIIFYHSFALLYIFYKQNGDRFIDGIKFNELQWREYTKIGIGPKSDSIFVNTCLPIFYDIDTLKRSSLTGTACPAKKDSIAPDKLDEERMKTFKSMYKI